MNLKCSLGFHSWVGCKCSGCGKSRDEQHDWSPENGKCKICGKNQNEDFFIDERDGKRYKIVKIGTQWIMAENLAYKPHNQKYWSYLNDASNMEKYGCLYDWETAKRIAPPGWHLPSINEWETLYNHLGGDAQKVFSAIKKGGTSGFNVLFGGCRGSDGKFYGVHTVANFWSSTISGTDDAWYFCCDADYGSEADLNDYESICGFSVRFFRDE